MRWVGKRTLNGGRLEVGRYWFAWRGWRRPTSYRIGSTRVFSVGPVAIFVQAPNQEINSLEDVEAWMRTLYPKYGEKVEVAPLAPEDHTHIDPIAELKMKAPHLSIIAVDPAGEGSGS